MVRDYATLQLGTDDAVATKATLAVEMIEPAIAADLPFARVAAESVYGVCDIEQPLRHAGRGWVLVCRATFRA